MIGRVTSVEQSREGVILDGDHAEGVTSLTVVDALDLDAEGGRLVLPGGEVVEHDAFDPEGVSVPLVGALPVPVEDAELLEVYPPLVSTVAYVATDDEDGATPVPVEVPSGVSGWSTLAPGASLRFEVTRAGDLVATDVISGALEVAADQVSDGTLRSKMNMSGEAELVLGDEPEYTSIKRDGIRLYVPTDMGSYPAVNMLNGEISFGVMGEDGTRIGGISSDGSITGTDAAFNSLTVGGVPFIGQEDGSGWLDALPRGVLPGARNFKSTPESTIVTGVERAYLRVNAVLHPGRLYRVKAWMRANLRAAGGALTLALRWDDSGSPATLSSPQVPETSSYSFPNASANHRVVGWVEAFVEVESETQARFLLTYRGDYGATPAASITHMYVEDVGPSALPAGGEEDGPETVQYTTTWQATASRMYDQTGAAIPDSDGRVDLWYWNGDPPDYQQSAVLFGGGAVESTRSLEVGKSLPGALIGATITKVEVYLRNKVWFGPGVIALTPLEAATLPSSKVIDATVAALHAEGGGKWHNVNPLWFTNGANRGVCLGDKDGSSPGGASLASGSFHGIDDDEPPLLRITYTR